MFFLVKGTKQLPSGCVCTCDFGLETLTSNEIGSPVYFWAGLDIDIFQLQRKTKYAERGN